MRARAACVGAAAEFAVGDSFASRVAHFVLSCRWRYRAIVRRAATLGVGARMDGVGVAVVRWQGWRWRRPRRRPWAAVVAHNDIAATRPDLGRLQTSDRQSATVSGQTVDRKSQLTCSQSHLLTDVRQTSQPLSQGKRLAGSLNPPPPDDIITRRQILWDEHSVDDGRHLHCVATFRVCTIHLVAPAGLVAACRGLECRPTRGDLSPAPPARWDRVARPF